MRHKTLEVTEFLGADRNRVKGQADGVLAPVKLFNLVPDRRGGYTPFGRRVDKATVLPHLDRLVGFDEGGFLSMTTVAAGVGELVLNRGISSFPQRAPDYADVEHAAHLALTGAYISRDKFLILDREDNPMSGPLTMNLSAAAESEDSSEGQVVTVGVSQIREIIYDGPDGGKRWMLVNAAGEIWESETGDEWTLLHTATSGLNGIAYGNSAWVAVGTQDPLDSHDTGQPSIIITASAADTSVWTDVTPAGAMYFHEVNYVAGNFVASGRELWISGNGTAWTKADDTHENLSDNFDTRRVVANGDHLIAPVYNQGAIQFISAKTAYYESVDGGTTWTQQRMGSCTKRIVDIDFDGGTLYGFVAQTGDVWRFDGTTDTKAADNLINGDLTVIRYNPATDSWFLAGEEGSLFESKDLTTFTPIDGSGVLSGGIYAMGVDASSGRVLVGGDNGELIAAVSRLGLPEGAYEVVAISYFNTRAGKFVFDITSEEETVVGRGGRLFITAPTREKLVADTMATWGMTYDDPLYATEQAELLAVAAGVKVDIYLKYDPNAVGNTAETEETYAEIVNEPVTVYDFTASLESGAADGTFELGVIEETPLGSELGGGKGVTTIVYDDPKTAVHGGRVWGMAAQDADRYPDDGTSLEIANVFGDFVLTYSEPGWANLVRPDNYLPLRPTPQSDTFTGITPTPAGVMVFFNNEIFVVNGDAALGTLSYDLYPDTVGNDEGATPCTIGGVPFCVWKGRIYALVGGRKEDVSGPVYRQDDPFVQIAPEPQENSLLALTAAGEVWRYDFTRQFWSNNVVSDDVVRLLPNCNCVDGDNTLYADAAGALYVARRDGTPDTPKIVYRGIDFGSTRKRKAVYRVSVPVEEMNPVGGELAPVPAPGGGGGASTMWPTSHGQALNYRWEFDGTDFLAEGKTLTRTIIFDVFGFAGARDPSSTQNADEREGGAIVDYGDYVYHTTYGVAVGYDGVVRWVFEPDDSTVTVYQGIATPEYIYINFNQNLGGGTKEYLAVLDPATGERLDTIENPNPVEFGHLLYALGDGSLIWARDDVEEVGGTDTSARITFDGTTLTVVETGLNIVKRDANTARFAITRDGSGFYTDLGRGGVLTKLNNDLTEQWSTVYAAGAQSGVVHGNWGRLLPLADGTILAVDNSTWEFGVAGATIVRLSDVDGSVLDSYTYPYDSQASFDAGEEFPDGKVILYSAFAPSELFIFDTATWTPVTTVDNAGNNALSLGRMDTTNGIFYMRQGGGNSDIRGIRSDGSTFTVPMADASFGGDPRMVYPGGFVGFWGGIAKWEFTE